MKARTLSTLQLKVSSILADAQFVFYATLLRLQYTLVYKSSFKTRCHKTNCCTPDGRDGALVEEASPSRLAPTARRHARRSTVLPPFSPPDDATTASDNRKAG